jgi:heterodisulfide reductase subunit A
MIPLREQVALTSHDFKKATSSARSLAMAALHGAKYHPILRGEEVKVHPDVLVIGGGIAGMQASLDIARAGRKAYLVERQPTIGGHMLQFDKTFPTLDCAACIGTPKMVSVAQESGIGLRRQFQGQNPSQAALRQGRCLHGMRGMRRGLPR